MFGDGKKVNAFEHSFPTVQWEKKVSLLGSEKNHI